MKQILHILKKDARHLWVQILTSVALTTALALTYPRQWTRSHYALYAVAGGLGLTTDPALELYASLLVLLVPVGWCILITHLIHAESLVGDRQFWVTRPYDWKKLLAAKTLFLLVFLYLPTFIFHCAILSEGGFHPLSYLPGLLFNLLVLITCTVVLPLITLASVTSSFARMTLALLAVFFAFVVLSSLPHIFNAPIVSIPYEGSVSVPLVVGVFVTVVVVQYAVRRVWLSRSLLLALPLLLGVMEMASPDAALMQQAYTRPTGSQHSPFQIALHTEPFEQETVRPDGSSKTVVFSIPLEVSGVEEGTAIQADNVRISVEASNGFSWSSPWQSTHGMNFLPGTQLSGVDVSVSRAFYDQVKQSPVTIHITFALTRLRAGQMNTIPLPGGDFAVPGIGVCWPEITWDRGYTTGINCRSAVRQARFSYVRVLWSATRCSGAQAATPAEIQGGGWVGVLDQAPANFAIAPVWTNSLGLFNASTDNRNYTPENRHLCPGTPVVFTSYNLAGRTQADFTIAGLRMPSLPLSAP